jgi:AraC family transcriptional regulator
VMAAVRQTGAAADGRRFIRAIVGPLEVTRLAFPAGYSHGTIDPERGYVVVLLDGAVCKTFARDGFTLSRDNVATLPAGAAHSSEFAATGTQVLVVRSAGEEPCAALGSLVDRRRVVRASASTLLAWRIAGELEARDAGWSLALEGLALQLLALSGRAGEASPDRTSAWLSTARELLDARVPELPSLTELAALVGRHPTHVARAFRREYGVTVAEYARSLRLDWAAAQLQLDGAPLARIAADAGFADQSHFTRAFRRHTGVTPGRYRALIRRS